MIAHKQECPLNAHFRISRCRSLYYLHLVVFGTLYAIYLGEMKRDSEIKNDLITGGE